MLYLLDTNVLITAKNNYYEFGRVDQYWEWLAFQAREGHAKLPYEIYLEVVKGNDTLVKWAKEHRSTLVLDEEVDTSLFRRVIAEGYAPDLTDIELEALGNDPFLVAYALADPPKRTIVTTEVRKKTRRQNRKLPNVCDDLDVSCCNQWQLGRDLDFRADWKKPL